MPAKHPDKDRNFDDLSQRFSRNIYDSPKGRLRLAVLKRDFQQFVDRPQLDILDAGAGQGQFGLWLAQQGHKVVLTDISSEMLAEAQKAASAHTFEYPPAFYQRDLWSLRAALSTDADNDGRYDLVACHAVLEWLENPLDAVAELAGLVRPGGWLSLLFYNVHGLVFKNLLRASYKRVLNKDLKGQKGSLTPINPLDPNEVLAAVANAGLVTAAHSGVRVFHDYILNRDDQAKDYATAEALELALSTQEPYRSLGRYVHVLARKV
ncbi:MAG TPA: methyltransferase domain-containing protein [Marinagarivorans sp.]